MSDLPFGTAGAIEQKTKMLGSAGIVLQKGTKTWVFYFILVHSWSASVVPTVNEAVVMEKKAAKKKSTPAPKPVQATTSKPETVTSSIAQKEAPQPITTTSEPSTLPAERSKISFGLKRKTEGVSDPSKKPRL